MTAAVNMLREAPFETRRRMLAMMMFGVPMTALTMATVGVSAHFIAPLAMVIPGKNAGFFEQSDIFKSLFLVLRERNCQGYYSGNNFDQ